MAGINMLKMTGKKDLARLLLFLFYRQGLCIYLGTANGQNRKYNGPY